MSTKLKHQTTAAGGGGGGTVTAMPSRCACEGCGKKSDLMNFCTEHYGWFKYGLITKEGKKPVDFDKKFQAYSRKTA